MTTLAEADTNPHHASVMAEGPPPPTPHEPLTSAPASLLHYPAAPLPSSSQHSALSESTRPKSLNISTSDVSSFTNNPPTLAHDDSTTSPSSAVSSQAESQDTGSTDLLDRKPLHVVENLKTKAAHEQRSLSTSQSPEPTSLSGTKRTATGQLKRSSVNGLGDLVANGSSHTRTSSMVSNGSHSNSNVLEVNKPSFFQPLSCCRTNDLLGLSTTTHKTQVRHDQGSKWLAVTDF
jgi:hypothetical protein